MKKLLFVIAIFLISLTCFGQLEYFKGFREGYKEGYCHLDPGCVAPATPALPIPMAGESYSSYKDGYNRGFSEGIKQKSIDQKANDTQENHSKNEIISMYNPGIQDQLIYAAAKRQTIFDQNIEYSTSLITWISKLQNETNDQELLVSLEKYKNKLLQFQGQDYSTLGNQLRQIEKDVDLELSNASARLNRNSENSKYKTGDLVRTDFDVPLRTKPNRSSNEVGRTSKNQIVRIIRPAENSYYEVEFNGRSAYISEGYIWGKAERKFSTIESTPSNDYELTYNSAVEAYKANKFPEAREYLNLLISKDKDPEILYMRGFIFYSENDFQNAFNDFSETLMLNPQDTGAYFMAAYSAYFIKDYKNSLMLLSRGIQLSQRDPNAFYYRAQIKSELGDKRSAIQDYDVLISNFKKEIPDDMYALVLNNKAYCLVEIGNFESALPLVNKALDLIKDKYFIWDTRGELYYKTQKYYECLEDMTRALAIEENANSYFYRGMAKIMLKIKTGCSDLSKAGELGMMEAYESIKKYCNN